MADATREVVVSIKTVPDKGNAGTFRQLAEGVKAISAAGSRAIEKSSRDIEKANAAAEKAAWKAADASAKAAEKAARESVKARERAERDAQKLVKETMQLQAKAAKEAEKQQVALAKAQEKAAKEQERAQANLRRAAEQASTRQREEQAKLSEASKGVLEGVAQLGRGVAMLGIAGEEDTKKLLEYLVKIQATFDLMKGSVTVVQKLTEGYRAYRAAVASAAAAQVALAAAQAKGGAAGAAGLAGGAVRGAGLIAGAGALSAATTVGLALTAAAAATSAVQVLTETIRGKTGPGSWSDTIGGWQASAGSWLYGATGLDVSRGTRLGFSRGSSDFKDLYESNQRTRKAEEQWKGERERVERIRAQEQDRARIEAAREEMTQQQAARERQLQFLRRGGRADGLNYGTRSAEAESARQAAMTAAEAVAELERQGRGGDTISDARRVSEQAQARLDEARRRQQEGERGLRAASWLGNADVVAASAARDQASARVTDLGRKFEQARAAGSPTADRLGVQLEAARQLQADAMQREIDASNRRLQTERDISRERLSAVNASIQGAEQEISIRRGIIQSERERLRGAEQRFGAMDPLEQQRVRAVLEQARAGLQLLEPDLQLLESLGTRETARLVERQRAESARRGGFGEMRVGAEERANIAEQQRVVGALEVRLRDDRQVRVRIERDDDRLVRRMTAEVVDMMNQRDEALFRRFTDEVRAAAGQREMRRQSGERAASQ